MDRWILCVAVLVAIVGSLQAKSLSSRQVEETQEDDDTGLWQPPGGAAHSRGEWLRCHGFPCDEWERTQKKLQRLKHLAMPSRAVMLDDEMDPMNSLRPANGSGSDEDDSLDGCIWLTEEQVDAIGERLEEEWRAELQKKEGGSEEADLSSEEEGLSSEEEELSSEEEATVGRKGRRNGQTRGQGRSRQKRKLKDFSSYPFGLWDLPLPWKFDGSHYEQQRLRIRGAFSHWEAQTCVRFRELEVGELYSESHLLITRERTGCHSFIGRLRGSPQQLNLQDVCVNSFGTIVHEIGHSLGLWHEQQRIDRDDHVKVIQENLGYYVGQFVKQNTVSLGVPYDVGSVMHYDSYAGSKNGQRTMETVDPLEQQSLGQRTGLSFMDAKIINMAYCQGVCTSDLPRPCQHGGYQDPNHCSICKCPDGFSGRYCTDLAPSNADCGSDISVPLDGSPVYVTSPGYQGNGYYENNQQCNWRLTAPTGYNVQLEFVDQFGVYCHYAAQCHHWVEVKYNRDTLNAGTQGARFCCYQRPDVLVVSEDQEMMVTLRTNWTAKYDTSRRGFKARAIAVKDRFTKVATTSTTTTKTTPTITTTTAATVRTTPSTTTTPPTANPKKECQQMDLAFVLDSSGSVMEVNWFKVLAFTQRLISYLTIGPQDVRVGVVSYGNEATAHIALDDYDKEMDLAGAIDRIAFKDQWTNTGAGLRVAREKLFERSPRSNARKVIVMMTDGEANRDKQMTLPEVELLRRANIEVLVVAVGGKANLQEATAIAGDDSRVLAVSDFDELMTTVTSNRLLRHMCDDMLMGTEGPPTALWSCSFEDSQDPMCEVTQSRSDDFDWTRGTGPTPSAQTGPPAGAFHGDFYIYIEASSPRRSDDVARITLPSRSSTGDMCINFHYNMYGYHVNNLRLHKVTESGSELLLWQRSKQQGTEWLGASVDVRLNSGDKLEFVGQRGKEYSGDIALDDLVLLEGSCVE